MNKVKIINNTNIYVCYDEWIINFVILAGLSKEERKALKHDEKEKYNKLVQDGFKSFKWAKNEVPPNGSIGELILVHEHEVWKDQLVCWVRIDDKHFMMNKEALQEI